MPDQNGKDNNGAHNGRKRAGIGSGLFTARIKPLLCVGCDECLAVCRHGVLSRTAEGKVEAQSGRPCVGCLKCLGVCRTKAIQILPGTGLARTR